MTSMSILKMTFAISILFTISACNNNDGGSNSKDSNGNCSSQFVSDYNNVKFEINRADNMVDKSYYSDSEKVKQLQSTQNACHSFFFNHPNVSCRAEVDHQPKQVHSTDLKHDCDLVDDFFNKLNSSKKNQDPSNNSSKSPSPQPIEKTYDSKYVSEISANKLKLVILDSFVFKASMNDSSLVIIGGKSGSMESFKTEIVKGAAICMIASTNSSSWSSKIYNNVVLNVSTKTDHSLYEDQSRMILYLEDETLSLGCIKINSKPFTVREIREALNGIVEITVSE